MSGTTLCFDGETNVMFSLDQPDGAICVTDFLQMYLITFDGNPSLIAPNGIKEWWVEKNLIAVSGYDGSTWAESGYAIENSKLKVVK